MTVKDIFTLLGRMETTMKVNPGYTLSLNRAETAPKL